MVLSLAQYAFDCPKSGSTIDPVNKIVHLTLREVGISSCSGKIPTAHGTVSVKWNIQGERIVLETSVPKGYSLMTKNISGKQISKSPKGLETFYEARFCKR
ncbi:MAG: hypothetical protein KAS23_17160 [Anaerohalosphaera sp.]|nr:hypothetical protein [Anaerohalosphaera sp.]